MRWALVTCVVAACEFSNELEPPPNTEPLIGCSIECHGAENSNAPPRSVSGGIETTTPGVGAHQVHMNKQPAWHMPVKCEDCHIVPTDKDSPGHRDGDDVAEVKFSARTGASRWSGTTCTTICHGNLVWGGTNTTVNWTVVDGTQVQCGSCHGAPPPAPHPAGTNCGACHPTMEENQLAFRDPASHINSKLEVATEFATGGCSTCHGSSANAAPPRDLAGNTSSAKVGAHQAHLTTSSWRHQIPCSTCHVVPLTADAPGHRDADNVAELTFDTLNPAATYSGGTCSNLYCHGNGRGNNGTASWTSTTPYNTCGRCHSTTGNNMSGRHGTHLGESVRCFECHSTVVNAAMSIVNADLHINGVHEVKMANGTFNATTRTCSNVVCHGSESW